MSVKIKLTFPPIYSGSLDDLAFVLLLYLEKKSVVEFFRPGID